MKFCTMRRFYATDFDENADEFHAESTIAVVAQAVVAAVIFLCAGLAVIAALSI